MSPFGFKLQVDVCNRCYDVLMISMNLSNITILNIHGVNYRCTVNGIDKSETVSLLQNIHLTNKKMDHYEIFFFILYKKFKRCGY